MAKTIRKKKTTPSSMLPSPVIGSLKPEDRQDFSIRQISNGYILRTSGVRDGKYFENEVFSPKKPTVNVVKAKV